MLSGSCMPLATFQCFVFGISLTVPRLGITKRFLHLAISALTTSATQSEILRAGSSP